MVGQSLVRSAPAEIEIFRTSRAQLDLTRTEELIDYFKFNKIEAEKRVGPYFLDGYDEKN